MSKAILVMDMPECCRKCDLRVIGDYNFCTGTGGRKIDQITIINEDIKPDWCPLREAPQRKDLKKIGTGYTGYSQLAFSEAVGYNVCLSKILEGSKK